MKQKQAAVRAGSLTVNDNISVPVGTVTAVREYISKSGLGPVLADTKKKGVPLLPFVTALIMSLCNNAEDRIAQVENECKTSDRGYV